MQAHGDRQRGQSVVEFALMLPLMLVILLAIVDFARIYTTTISVESAAREAADYGTTFGAEQWSAVNKDTTVVEMQRRACVAAQNLADYVDADSDPSNGCANPSFDYCLTPTVGGTCGPFDAAAGCENPLRANPCTVTVRLGYTFHLLVPVNVNVFGTTVGVPPTLAFERDSTFAVTDIDLATSAPTP